MGEPSVEIELGAIAGVFGVRGEARLFLHNRDSDFLARPRRVTLALPDGRRVLAELRARPGAGGKVLARIADVDSLEEVELLVGARILVPRSALPAVDATEFYVGDVVGKPAREDGRPIGVVAAVHPGEVDVLEIALDGADEVAYVPCLKARIVAIGPDGVDIVPGAVVREEA